jgi:tetratricopeptide (TPR) repeat protein
LIERRQAVAGLEIADDGGGFATNAGRSYSFAVVTRCFGLKPVGLLVRAATLTLQSRGQANPTHAFYDLEKRASLKEKRRAMKLNARIPTLVALLALLGTATGCNFLKSRDQLNKGIAAFKNAQYEQATNYFQNAVQLDPKNPNAKLYLATTYASQVVPNLMTPENLAIAQKALDGFNAVLATSPNDPTALKQIASIDRNIGKLDQAKADELKVIQVLPNDPEAYYIIGSIDWNTEHYKNTIPILAADGLTDDGEGNKKMTKGACEKIKAANTDIVNDAMKNLQKAIDLNPTYDDAMSYLQLTYRSKANIDCPDDAARKADLAQSDAWIQKAMGARKINELKKEAKAGGGVTM